MATAESAFVKPKWVALELLYIVHAAFIRFEKNVHGCLTADHCQLWIFSHPVNPPAFWFLKREQGLCHPLNETAVILKMWREEEIFFLFFFNFISKTSWESPVWFLLGAEGSSLNGQTLSPDLGLRKAVATQSTSYGHVINHYIGWIFTEFIYFGEICGKGRKCFLVGDIL